MGEPRRGAGSSHRTAHEHSGSLEGGVCIARVVVAVVAVFDTRDNRAKPQDHGGGQAMNNG